MYYDKGYTRKTADAVDLAQDPVQVQGRVKWFDQAKGFGFIFAEQIDGDILLHASVLRNFGHSSVAEDALICVTVQLTARGAQATEVFAIRAPEGKAHPISEELRELDPATIASLPLEPARVKWFDKKKGFGFANVFDRAEDVYVHVEVLRRAGFAEMQPGEAICLRVFDGIRGHMAAQVLSWECRTSL